MSRWGCAFCSGLRADVLRYRSLAFSDMKRTMVIMTILATMIGGLAGCDKVKAGGRCKAGAAPGRDATHVLFCTNSRWKRTLTIQQATDFIVGTLPGKIEVTAGGSSARVGATFEPTLQLKVTNRNGQPRAKAMVTLTGPASGAGLRDNAPVTTETDADGVASFRDIYAVNTVAGPFSVTAKVDGSDVSTTFDTKNVADRAAKVAYVSGNNQTVASNAPFAPVIVKVTDAYANPVSGAAVYVQLSSGTPNQFTLSTDANGIAQMTPPSKAGPATVLGAIQVGSTTSSIALDLSLTVNA